MIRNLNQETFQKFGTVLSAPDAITKESGYAVALDAVHMHSYCTVGDTKLWNESGICVLSVSTDGSRYEDFYLDKPVLIRAGLWFNLTVPMDKAVVRLGGDPMPRLLEAREPSDSFFRRPHLRPEALCTFFYQEKEQSFFYAGESHPMLELTYVDEGTLHSVADGKDTLLRQGELTLYAPNQWHMQYSDIGVAPRFLTVSFMMSGQGLEVLYNRKFRASQSVLTALQHMQREKDRADAYMEDMILSQLQQLLVALLRNAEQPEEKLPLSNSINSENETIRKAQQFISGRVREKLTVPMVAKGVEVSPSYLTALFHKHLQISPGEYIRRIKLQQSKQMIREGNLNFTQISEALQYSTVHHFSRQFKEKFGLTPTEYARSVR